MYGCPLLINLDSLNTHLKDCEYNPKRPIPCEQGCGMIIPKDELKDHNCIRELRSIVQSQQTSFNAYQQQISELKFIMNEYKRELTLLKVNFKHNQSCPIPCQIFLNIRTFYILVPYFVACFCLARLWNVLAVFILLLFLFQRFFYNSRKYLELELLSSNCETFMFIYYISKKVWVLGSLKF